MVQNMKNEEFIKQAKIFGVERFELKQEHVKLLQKCYVGWNSCEFGAPEINCKRPYGNSGSYQIYCDMAEILNIKPVLIKDEEPIFSDEQEECLDKLHHELEDALQIVLTLGTFDVGLYEKVNYCSLSWRKVTEQSRCKD